MATSKATIQSAPHSAAEMLEQNRYLTSGRKDAGTAIALIYVSGALAQKSSAYTQIIPLPAGDPIGDSPDSILVVTKTLFASREYYPVDKRLLQTVAWD